MHKGVASFPMGVARRNNRARAVNARDHGPLANNWSFVGDGQAIFVVQCGVGHPHMDVAFRQLAFVHWLDRRIKLGFFVK